MAERTTGARLLRTTMAGGHIAGHGCIEDDYSEKSGCRQREKPFEKVRFPNDRQNPEDLNGPVIIVQKGRNTE